MILFSKSIYKSKAVLISEIARAIIDWTQGICFAITEFKTILYFWLTCILRCFLRLRLVWVRFKLSRYILRHSTEQMIFDVLRVNPRSCFDKSNIASLGIAIKRRFGKVFVNVRLHQTKSCHARRSITIFLSKYRDKAIKESVEQHIFLLSSRV